MWPSAAARLEEEELKAAARKNRVRSRSRSPGHSRSRDDDANATSRYTVNPGGSGLGRTCKRLFDAHEATFSAAPSSLEDSKRLRDSPAAAASSSAVASTTTAAAAAFTCSLLDNPASNALLWFGPQDGAVKGIKSRSNRSGRPRGVFRRSRFLRSSPKPVSSLESCLRAQLRFDEDKQSVSRPLFFSPYAGGSNTPGLGELEALDAAAGEHQQCKPACLPPLLRFRACTSVRRSSSGADALLFSFGVTVGVQRIKGEVDRLQRLLEEAEATIRSLQGQVEPREEAQAPTHGVTSIVKVESSSIDVDRDSERSGLTAEQQHDNMAELEAQLEAELELMQLQGRSIRHHKRIFSGISDLDADELGEIVRDELTIMGLPGVSDVEDDRVPSQRNVSNWAVSPRELDRRLRMLLESRQEERISELETQLQDAQNKLLSTESELQSWKNRVQQLSELSLFSGETTVRLEKIREQSPVDDICDEFLRSVDETGFVDVMAVSCSAEADEDSRFNDAPSAAPSTMQMESNRNFSSRHAGANTPKEDLHLYRLFNTPRDRARARPQRRLDREQPSVVDKIRYWENLAARSSRPDAPSSPEMYSQADHSCCSDGNTSWDDSSVSDDNEEQHLGDGLIKRLVATKSKNSTLLKDVQLMLAALDDDAVAAAV